MIKKRPLEDKYEHDIGVRYDDDPMNDKINRDEGANE